METRKLQKKHFPDTSKMLQFMNDRMNAYEQIVQIVYAPDRVEFPWVVFFY